MGPTLALLAALLLAAAPARAETLRAVLTGHGAGTPPAGLAALDQPLASYQVLDDASDLLVVWAPDPGADGSLRAVRFARAAARWSARTIAWVEGATPGGLPLPSTACRSGLALERFPGGFLLRAHINPSAECTIVLGPDLTVRGVLAGRPVATFPDGRLVYQRNQVHFAPVHPVALALFDLRAGETALYPPRPARGLRLAQIDRARALFTEPWCRAHNHPCDPETLDESVASPVATDPAGDALAFVTAWDNTAGWSDTERWGRLEPFRELRAALPDWDGASPPPDALFRGLAEGLARTRTLGREADVRSALAPEPALRDLVAAVLAAPAAAGRDPRSQLTALDARWAEPATWRALARAVAVPDETTEVVYVYAGLRRPATLQYRELRRADFEARFGPGLPERALEPAVRRALFRADGN
jgi:hypothetical protein